VHDQLLPQACLKLGSVELFDGGMDCFLLSARAGPAENGASWSFAPHSAQNRLESAFSVPHFRQTIETFLSIDS
jgi:hypothetical protein